MMVPVGVTALPLKPYGHPSARAALLAVGWCLCLMSCTVPATDRPLTEPIVVRAGDPATADRLVVVVPGALTSVGMFDPILGWADRDTAVVAYRLPGMDGLPLDGPVEIAEAGRGIAAFVNELGPKSAYLIGFSVGGPVVIEAAKSIRGPSVRLALISSARPAPALQLSAAGAAFDIASAAIRAKGLGKGAVWKEYYRTLLFGRGHFRLAPQAGKSTRIAEENAGRIVLPTVGLTRAHGASLARWTLPRHSVAAVAGTTMFHGAEDTVFPLRGIRRFATRVQANRVLVYPGIGHLLFLAAPQVFQDIKREFGL